MRRERPPGEEAPEGSGEVLSGVRLSAPGLGIGAEALSQLFDSVPVGISISAGPKHRIVYANNHYRRALMPGSSDPIGREVAEIFGKALQPRIYGARDRAFAEQRIVSVREEPVLPGPDGPAMYWDVTYFPVNAEDGERGLLLFAVDVTEKVIARRKAEEKAREEKARAEEAAIDRQRLALAIEATELGIWEWNVETGETIWSERQKEIWGLDPGDPVTYEVWRESLHPEDRGAVLARVERTRDPTSGGEQRMEHRIVRPGGEVRWIASRARMIYEEGTGRPLRLIGTVLDITRLKRSESELKDALAAKEILLSEVNHRTKNSLQLISAMLALQGRRSKNEEVRRIVTEAQARLQIVATVHERLYRSDDMRSVELGGFLETLARDIEQAMLQAQDRISVTVTAEPVVVGNDRAVLVGLVLNELLTNAIKYAYPDRKGTISVTVGRALEGGVLLAVEDEGAGLPGDFSERERSSLGFRIVKGLARQIGSELRIVPRTPGVRFEISFRLEQ
jgi:PAS domain S-box-containing protein